MDPIPSAPITEKQDNEASVNTETLNDFISNPESKLRRPSKDLHAIITNSLMNLHSNNPSKVISPVDAENFLLSINVPKTKLSDYYDISIILSSISSFFPEDIVDALMFPFSEPVMVEPNFQYTPTIIRSGGWFSFSFLSGMFSFLLALISAPCHLILYFTIPVKDFDRDNDLLAERKIEQEVLYNRVGIKNDTDLASTSDLAQNLRPRVQLAIEDYISWKYPLW